MGQLENDATKVFKESCCDGGAACNESSTQPCGCDPGCKTGPYLCEQHWRQTTQAMTGAIVIPQRHTRAVSLPADPKERKKYPVASGVLDYFPDALVAIARVSWAGNEQHNPGQPLHWAREKSTDQDDTIIRHFLERGKLDSDGMRHSAKLAWRALALLQLEIEAEGK